MAVDKNTIKIALQALYTSAQSGISDANFADAMADIIKNAILSADVTGQATGVQSGGSTAPVTGSLS